MRTLTRIGDRLLSALVPQISAAACVPPDNHTECDYSPNDDCGAIGLQTEWAVYYDCVGNTYYTEVGCCG